MDLIQGQMQQAQFASAEGDMERLKRLYKNPENADQQKLKKTAQEFEAIFFQQMLDAMDKTINREDSMFGNSEGEKVFREMMNKEIAMSVASGPGGSGFGLAESIYQQTSLQLEAETKGKNALKKHQENVAPMSGKRIDVGG